MRATVRYNSSYTSTCATFCNSLGNLAPIIHGTVRRTIGERGEGGHFMHSRSRTTINIRVPTKPRWITSGFHRPGTHMRAPSAKHRGLFRRVAHVIGGEKLLFNTSDFFGVGYIYIYMYMFFLRSVLW